MDLHTYTATRGRSAALASAEEVSTTTVAHWSSGKKPIPALRRASIERATNGRVTVEEMGNDVSWTRIPDPAWPHPAGRPLIDVAQRIPTTSAAQPETQPATPAPAVQIAQEQAA